MKELRTLSVLKLIELFNSIPEFDYSSFIEEIFAAAVHPKVSTLNQNYCFMGLRTVLCFYEILLTKEAYVSTIHNSRINFFIHLWNCDNDVVITLCLRFKVVITALFVKQTPLTNTIYSNIIVDFLLLSLKIRRWVVILISEIVYVILKKTLIYAIHICIN